ncbi:MAG: YdjY domain-containing protein [Akkermansiaceae bacterium]
MLTRSVRCLLLLQLIYCCNVSQADTTKSKDKSVAHTPLVKKIAPHIYQIGIITFNKETREIYIPAQTNITDPGAVIEYLLVHSNGEKIHESLLTTAADPTHINIALKLLNYKESQELFRIRDEKGFFTEKYPIVADDIKKAARFEILITSADENKEKTIPITNWIYNQATEQNMIPVPWIYNGSFIHKKAFNAKLTGSIIAIYPNSGAIANYSGDDRSDDSLWAPSKNTPEQGTSVKVILKPWAPVP